MQRKQEEMSRYAKSPRLSLTWNQTRDLNPKLRRQIQELEQLERGRKELEQQKYLIQKEQEKAREEGDNDMSVDTRIQHVSPLHSPDSQMESHTDSQVATHIYICTPGLARRKQLEREKEEFRLEMEVFGIAFLFTRVGFTASA